MITASTTKTEVCDAFAAAGINVYYIENTQNPTLNGFVIGYGYGMPNNPFGWNRAATVAFNRDLLKKAEALGFVRAFPDRLVDAGNVIPLRLA